MQRPFIDVREELSRRTRIRFPVLSGVLRSSAGGDPESRLLSDLSFRRSAVIALDTTSLDTPGNLAEFQVFSYVVFLDTPFEELWQRELDKRSRSREPEFPESWLDEKEWRKGWEERRMSYLQADLCLDTSGLSSEAIAALIIHCFYT